MDIKVKLPPKVQTKKGRKKRSYWKTLPPVNAKEIEFLKNYADKNSPTYGSPWKSYIAVYKCAESTAKVAGAKKLKGIRMQRTLKEIFDSDEIRDLITNGMRERLKDPMTRHFQASAEFVTKVLGEIAPEKHINLNLDGTDREAFYNKVVAHVEALTSGQEEEPLPQIVPEKKPLPEGS